jgi:hypothetical protein
LIVRATPGEVPDDWDNWVSLHVWNSKLSVARFASGTLRNVIVDLTDEQVAHIREWIIGEADVKSGT